MTTTTMRTTKWLPTTALLTTLALAPACGDLGSSATVDKVAFTPDGSLLVFMPTGIHVFGTSLDRETRTIVFDGLPVATNIEGPTRYSLSADGRVAAVSFPTPLGTTGPSTVALFDIPTGTRVKTFHLDDAAPSGQYGYEQGVWDLELSPQGDLLYAQSLNEEPPFRSTVYEVASGSPLWNTDRLFNSPTFSADGTRLFVISALGIEALDARTGTTLASADLEMPGSYLGGLSLTADGKLAGIVGRACANAGDCPPSFSSWSPSDLAPLGETALPSHVDASAVFSPDLVAFACSPWNGLCALEILDFSKPAPVDNPELYVSGTDGTLLRRLPVRPVATSLAFSPDGRFIAAGTVSTPSPTTQFGTVEIIRIEDGELIGSLRFQWDIL